MKRVKSKQAATYDKRPRLAFQEGYYERIKVKRHYHQKYDRYHYYLPARLSPILRFLQEYFRALDTVCDIPEQSRYRQTEFEFADTAVLVFHHIRCRMSLCHPIVAGSAYISPVPWAVFGPTLGVKNKLMQHHFQSAQDIFNYYDQYMWRGGYNITKIERPLGLQPKNDALALLGDLYDRSANFILAATLLLLCDLIKHCGPDANELRPLFTNDKRTGDFNLIPWRYARQEVIPPDFDQLKVKAICVRSNTRQRYPGPYYYGPQRKPQPAYFDVDIRDACQSSHVDLTQGEKFERHGENDLTICNQKTPLLLPYYDDLDRSSPKDVNDDDEAARLDKEYQQIVSDPSSQSPELRKRKAWEEIATDWDGLD